MKRCKQLLERDYFPRSLAYPHTEERFSFGRYLGHDPQVAIHIQLGLFVGNKVYEIVSDIGYCLRMVG